MTAGGQTSVKPCSVGVQVEEEVDQRALETAPGTDIHGEATAGDLGAGREVEHAQRSATSQCGFLPLPS